MTTLTIILITVIERIVDRIGIIFIKTNRSTSIISLLVITLILLFSILTGMKSIRGALFNSKHSELPAFITEFRRKLPEGHLIKNNRLHHVCNKGRSVRYLARKYYRYTNIYTFTNLRQKFLDYNQYLFKNNHCIRGKIITVPDPILQPIENHPLNWTIKTEIRAVYLQGKNTRPHRLSREIKKLKDAGGNGVVFDVKDIIGVVNYPSRIAMVEEYRTHRPPIPDLDKTIRFLHKNNIYIIARMALFQDQNLSIKKPEYAIKNGKSILLTKGKPLWVDPALEAVQHYNLQLVTELIEAGVDEIQFDYIRYPAEGNLSQVKYFNVRKPSDKTQHLKRFLANSWFLTRGTGVKLAIDIFGITAWGENVDIQSTGQRIEELAPFVDVISPMLYPSHFDYGYSGFAKPADKPHYFYYHGVMKVLEKSSSDVVVRPWVQAFPWRVTEYGPEYIRQQIKGSRNGGGTGWMMWNAGNRYQIAYQAMRSVKNKKTP